MQKSITRQKSCLRNSLSVIQIWENALKVSNPLNLPRLLKRFMFILFRRLISFCHEYHFIILKPKSSRFSTRHIHLDRDTKLQFVNFQQFSLSKNRSWALYISLILVQCVFISFPREFIFRKSLNYNHNWWRQTPGVSHSVRIFIMKRNSNRFIFDFCEFIITSSACVG